MVWRDIANASITIVQAGRQLAGITAVDAARRNAINGYIRGGSRRRSFVGGERCRHQRHWENCSWVTWRGLLGLDGPGLLYS